MLHGGFGLANSPWYKKIDTLNLHTNEVTNPFINLDIKKDKSSYDSYIDGANLG